MYVCILDTILEQLFKGILSMRNKSKHVLNWSYNIAAGMSQVTQQFHQNEHIEDMEDM